MSTLAPLNLSEKETVAFARAAMACDIEAISQASARLDGSFTRAVEVILGHNGKVIVSGLGKSGLIAQKIVATLCSTGTPAVYLHPADAVHGDIGVYERGDPTVLISKNGTTTELLRLIPILRELNSPLIGIVGNPTSKLAMQMDVVLDGSVRCEADPLNLAPTTSTMVALALGDALSCALMRSKNFTVNDFVRFHPGGQLGRNVGLKVRDVFHGRRCVACVSPNSTLKEVVLAMTRFPLGAACVLAEDETLVGIITDGDLRRAFQAHDDIRGLRAEEIMTGRPISVAPDESLSVALQVMENRPSQISVLPVVHGSRQCLGLIRIHDIYSPA